MRRSLVAVDGGLPDLTAVLHGPADEWAPGQVLMRSPRHVKTMVPVLGVPVELNLLLDSPDVLTRADGRHMLVLPGQHWLPEVEGVLGIAASGDASAGGHQLVYEWRVHRDGIFPGPLARVVGRLLVQRIIPPAAKAIERLARPGR
ncbi:MAG TPA: hypothetical protein VMM13_12000 [Euzebya sp.]|nr:hypothetical protein [Euzebya sp.]